MNSNYTKTDFDSNFITENGEFLHEFYAPLIEVDNELSHRIEELFTDSKVNDFLHMEKKAKRRKSVSQCDKIRRNVAVYCGNLINSKTGAVAVSRQKKYIMWIPAKWHSYDNAILAQDLLCYAGLVEMIKGTNLTNNREKGFATLLCATDKFHEVFSEFTRQQPTIITDKIPSVDCRGCSRLFIPPQDEMAMVEELNTNYFANMRLGHSKIDIPPYLQNVYLTRIFRNDGGGRLYQLYGSSYQNIPKHIRRGLLINDKATTEIDYSSMHWSLLYALENITPTFAKAYHPVMSLLGLDTDDKDAKNAVKMAMFILLNAKSYGSYKQSFNRAEGADIRHTLERYGVTVDQVRQATITAHPDLQKYLHANMSGQLMALESGIMTHVLYTLHIANIDAVPLHDSVICEHGHETLVSMILRGQFKKYTGGGYADVECK